MAKAAALIEEAGRLAVEEGLSLAEIAAVMLDVSRATLESWSAKYEWQKRRKQYLRQNHDLDEYVRRIKLRLANMLMDDELDPQACYALARGLAVLKPAAQVELRNIEKAEREAAALSPEEKREKVKEAASGR